jgi:hypothetical protein
MPTKKTSMAEMIENIKNSVKTQFERKPILVVIVPLLFLLLLAVPVVFVLTSGTPDAEPSASSGGEAVPAIGDVKETPTIEILPETERVVPEKDPFGSSGVLAGSDAFVLTGIISSSGGLSTAIIKAGDSSFVVQAGDAVGDSDWSVSEINENSIVLSDGKTEKVLELDPDNQ